MLVVASTLEQDDHETGPYHPEQIGRLSAAVSSLKGQDFAGDLDWLAPRPATSGELQAVHDPRYLNGIIDLCAMGGGQIDPDTVVGSGSWDTARFAAGAGLAAVDAVASGASRAALVLSRPPGHHAGRASGMGFCIVNNIAVTAAALAARGEKVAIIDWDVHHGNGTQEIFWSDPSVLYVSLHQWPLYPGTGRVTERGEGPGLGTTMNLPLPPGSTGDTYLACFDEVILPAVERFSPTWLLISAGFDAHRDDPLADMSLSSADFADLTGCLIGLSESRTPLVLFLEGGYDLRALSLSVAACAARLLDVPYRPETATIGGNGLTRVADYRYTFSEGGLQT